eukprot:XP_011675768.1 PREDICTED: galactosylceramide sulfotransferase-like [Strongylocentrotus purpuratus]
MEPRLKKKEMLPLIFGIVAVLMCVYFTQQNGFTVVQTIQAGLDVESAQSVSRKQLPKPATSLVFIKTHKTGGTTMASILNRFGYRNRLSFLFNKGDKVHGHFRLSKLAQKKPRSFLPPLCVATGDYKHYKNYSMMTAHLRLLPNLVQLKRFMKSDCKFVSILREPSAQWESAFSFFGAARSMPISKRRRPGIPALRQFAHLFEATHNQHCHLLPSLVSRKLTLQETAAFESTAKMCDPFMPTTRPPVTRTSINQALDCPYH